MLPARFVTWCCLYAGVLFLGVQIFLYWSPLSFPVIWNAGAAICLLFTGLYRLYSETAEQYPTNYGLLTYGIAFLSVVVTGLFLVGVFVTVWQLV